jgi:stage III sporulation protein AF
MLKAASDYAASIFTIAVFTAFAGIIVPSGKYKKYIDLALGLILVIVMLEPVIALLGGDVTANIELSDVFAQTAPIGGVDQASGRGEDIQSAILQNAVAEALKEQTAAVVAPFGATITRFETRLDGEELAGVDMTIVFEARAPETERFIYVEPVEIRPFNIGAAPEPDTENEESVKNIKNAVSDFYNLPKDNINITVQSHAA